MTALPSRCTRTVSPSNRNSFGSRTAWLRPVLNTQQAAPAMDGAALFHRQSDDAENDREPARGDVDRQEHYRVRPCRRFHSARAERTIEKGAVTPSAISVQTKKNAPLELPMRLLTPMPLPIM